MIKKEYEELKSFVYNNKEVILIGLVFLIITFGYAVTMFTLGVSTETSVFNEASGSARWVAQSRFSTGILKKIFSTNQILPFRNSFLAVIMIFIVSIYSCKVLNKMSDNSKKNNKILNIVLTVLFITMPISVHYMYYLTYSFEIGTQFANVSGYTLTNTPYNSSFAGFKDWFIQDYNRPGFTIEAGLRRKSFAYRPI